MKIVFDNNDYELEHYPALLERYPAAAPLLSFIQKWENGASSFSMQTSGSTGEPKLIIVKRDQIAASVAATAKHLGLNNLEVILVALDTKYVASIMMAARAVVLDMDLVLLPPASLPFQNGFVPCDFASFVPFQIYQMMANKSIVELNKIRNILIGGAPLTKAAFDQLTDLNTNIYQTYGMTETVSHIALMRIEGDFEQAHYRLVDGVRIAVDAEDCLQVQGAVTDGVMVQTNDVVELLTPDTFRWLGRRDLVVNSGGVKIHPEQLEKAIDPILKNSNWEEEYFISSIADDLLGQRCVLVVSSKTISQDLFRDIQKMIEKQFSKYHKPHHLYLNESFEKTNSGKVKRLPSMVAATLVF